LTIPKYFEKIGKESNFVKNGEKMKKIILMAAASLIAVACGQKGPALIDSANFDTEIGGKNVALYTIKGGDITMQVTNFGGRVVTLFTPDRNGKLDDIVLGYENIDRYVNNTGERFLGAPVGRVANRIGAGHFVIDGVEYNTPINNNGQTLHGGLIGIDMVVWDVTEVTDSTITLSYTAPDMQDGFPGNLSIVMKYSLNQDNEFKVEYTATTDKKTIVNLSHHSFFNLKGESGGTILDNYLTINADSIVPTDVNLIPTGELMAVEGTPYDFREATVIGDRIGDDNEQLLFGKGYDVCWTLNRDVSDKEVKSFVTLYDPTNGRAMDVLTDQPGVQFYSGNFFESTTNGKYGKPHAFRESLALEAQNYPDAVNHENFPSSILEPGEQYSMTCIYKFYTK